MNKTNTITSLTQRLLSALLFTLFLFGTLLLSGCQTVDIRGQHVSDDLINKINESKMTKEQIIQNIGSPTYIPEYSTDTWYYIQRSQTKRAWLRPQVVDQRIVQIKFNSKDIAISAQLVENTHDDTLSTHGEYTATKGNDKNAVQKFVGNIGRFNKKQTDKKKKKK